MTGGVIFKDLHRTLARAADARLAEIVTLVDSMPERGEADALLAPLRARLGQLRPQRRLSFTRLLFMPADPIVVPGGAWRRDAAFVPRTALRPLSQHVRTALGPLAAEIDAEIATATCCDRAVVARLGARLWPRAAEILMQPGPAPDWACLTGLNAIDQAAIAMPLAALFSEAGSIEVMAHEAASGLPISPARLRACIGRAESWMAAYGPTKGSSLAMLMAVLLSRMPVPDDVLVAASDLAQAHSNLAARQAADLAIDMVLGTAEAALLQQADLVTASADLSRLAVLLDTLERPGPASRPTRKAAIVQLRRDIDARCRARFTQDLANCLQTAALLDRPAPDIDIATLESTARDLRRFEAASRAFGGGASYEKALGAASRTLVHPASRQAPIDVARLLEILDGPEAALSWLDTVS
jgi:hypothetical protein